MKLIRNIFAFLIGALAGSAVNGAILYVFPYIIPPPPNVDTSTMESLAAAMPGFGPEQFVGPFVAHALGTLAGAVLAALIAGNRKMRLAMSMGLLFLVGGIYMVYALPQAPLWFDVLDLGFAYLPFAFLGGWLVTRGKAL